MKVFKLNSTAKIPTRNLPTDAGVDIYASNYAFIPCGGTAMVSTSIAIQVPVGYVGKIEDRSSMAKKGLRIGAGVVDSGYSGEVAIVLHNLSNRDEHVSGVRGYLIQPGDRVAQLLLVKVETPQVEEVAELWTSDRGSNGFGSSGR